MARWTDQGDERRPVTRHNTGAIDELHDEALDTEPRSERTSASRKKRMGATVAALAFAGAAGGYAWAASHRADTILLDRYTDQQLLFTSGDFSANDGLQVTGPNRLISALLFHGAHPEVVLTLPGCAYQPEFKLEDTGTKHEFLTTTIAHSDENIYTMHGQVLSDHTANNTVDIAIHDSQELTAFNRQYLQGNGEVCHVAARPHTVK
ncbi:MAG TPA: hypothetical protein VFN56_02315 [Candidatus Saccharimonadales bacterium]|nr:hypothetical protein [Candidatus Saccharimonadales bacterium]